MTLLHYFIFLSCLLAFNCAILYSYFLRCEITEFEQIHNRTFTPTLLKAYPILVFSFFIGMVALFYFTPDKTWFIETKFLYFLATASILAVLGLIPSEKIFWKIIKGLLELAGIAGFVFIVPDNELFAKIGFPLVVDRIVVAVLWFILFKFLLGLNQFEGLMAAQAFHIGFSSFLILILLSFSFVSLLQINSMLSALIFMLAPFYYLLQYDLPLKGVSANALSFIITGLSFLMAMTGNWGIAVLMLSYILFELTICCCRLIKNMIFTKKKTPLFFFETLLEKDITNERIIGLIIRYNLTISCLIFFVVYISVQLQPVILAALLYLRLYFNIMNPRASKASLTDLYQQAKKDAKRGLTETGRTITELKEKYQSKATNQEEKKPNE